MRLIDADSLETHEIYEGEWRMVVYADDIDAAPTIDAEPVRRGHWLKAEWININTEEKRKGRRCSECGSGYFRYDISVNTVFDIPRFCPHCGAKMDGGKSDE